MQGYTVPSSRTKEDDETLRGLTRDQLFYVQSLRRKLEDSFAKGDRVLYIANPHQAIVHELARLLGGQRKIPTLLSSLRPELIQPCLPPFSVL